MEFPKKIILSQKDEYTKELCDYWFLDDYTDSIKKDYVCLDNVCEWLKQNQDLLNSNAEEFIETLRKAMTE